jgi:L-lactate dehydrogenase complex protein LldF
VLTPVYVGIENAGDLPNAATFCGECAVVCPVKIPLPDLMRKLREKQFDTGQRPWSERAALNLWSFTVQRPRLYAMLSKAGARIASWMGGRDKLIHRLPGIDGWTSGRDMPAPEGRTFRELYKKRGARKA